MNIHLASLALRFYKVDGWTKAKVRELLVDKNLKITYRKDDNSKKQKEVFGDLSYFAVYEKSGYKVFKKSEMMKHKFIDVGNFGGVDWDIGVDWYTDEDK